MNKTEQDIIYLAGCAMNQIVPDRMFIEDMVLDKITTVAIHHTISSMISFALESAGVRVEVLAEQKNKAIRKVMLLDNERQRIFRKMDEAGIWYVPLKGVLLKEMYPIYGMRQMADNDILFDKRYGKEVKSIFQASGYMIENFNNGNHDVYQKDPIYNYEMHRTLFDSSFPVFSEYYTQLEKKYLWDNKDVSYARHMDVNDAYVYIVAHIYKHFTLSGTGIRSLMDIYMYNQHCKKQMDREYIREQCKMLGILEYEEKARMIAYKLFEQPLTDYSILTKEEQEYVEYYFTSGTYGTLNQRMQNEIHKLELEGSKHAEAAYIFRRLFPSVSWFRKHYRILDKCPFLIPFYGIIRLIVKPFSSWKIWTGEMKALARVKKSSGDGE